jgi:pimeloyl-ACP methyl ester carboxylesterase
MPLTRSYDAPPPPNRLLTVLEPSRAFMEFGGLMAATPILLAAPRGDGHPVLVLSGLSGGAGWTRMLRLYLQSLGHSVHAPRFAATKGSSGRVRRLLSARVDELADRHGAPVSLVAWSVGGCFARQVAAAKPTTVRQIVTLGTPLDGMWYPKGQRSAAGPLKVPPASERPGRERRGSLQPPGHGDEPLRLPRHRRPACSASGRLAAVLPAAAELAGQP